MGMVDAIHNFGALVHWLKRLLQIGAATFDASKHGQWYQAVFTLGNVMSSAYAD